jgi:FMN phosphatase YigB (HAD superfamily)
MDPANHDMLFEIFCTLKTNLEPIDGAQQLFDIAGTRSWNIVVLTNGVPDAQIAKWSSLRLEGADRAVFIPARLVGGNKPKAEVFEAALDAVGGNWSTVLAVGDKFENDLAFPMSKGARTFHVSCDRHVALSETTSAGTLAQLVAAIRGGTGQ